MSNRLNSSSYSLYKDDAQLSEVFLNTLYCDVDFADTTKLNIIHGRWFSQGERNVTIITSDLAKQLWPNVSPLGRTILRQSRAPLTVIGIVDEIRFVSPLGKPTPLLIQSLDESFGPTGSSFLITRVKNPTKFSSTMLELRPINGYALSSYTYLCQLREIALEPFKTTMTAACLIGIIGLIISAMAMHTLLHQITASRRKEIAIRMALGANANITLLMLAKDITISLSIGTVGGCAMVIAAQRIISTVDLNLLPLNVAHLILPALVISILCVTITIKWFHAVQVAQPFKWLKLDYL